MVDKVKVPQDSGEIVISVAGGEPRTWRVQDGLVSPANNDERDLLLASVDGAKPAPSESKGK